MNPHDFDMLPFLHPFGLFAFPLLILVLIWTILIKGMALWKSARNGHKAWFVFLLIVNALGIPELVYLIWFAKESDKPTPAPSVADA